MEGILNNQGYGIFPRPGQDFPISKKRPAENQRPSTIRPLSGSIATRFIRWRSLTSTLAPSRSHCPMLASGSCQCRSSTRTNTPPEVDYGAGEHTFTKEKIGTRYVLLAIRTLVDPKNLALLELYSTTEQYNTAWFGKNHNVPAWQSSAAGPFDLWPTGLGFDYFYGFIGGDTDQWDSTLFENTAPIEPNPQKSHESQSDELIAG